MTGNSKAAMSALLTSKQSTITHEMFSALLELAKKLPVDSIETLVMDWITLIRITGLR
jgi:hypothetical protein